MKNPQQELPFRQWGGKRRGAGRKRKSPRPLVAHRVRYAFRSGALHVTTRVCDYVWNLRSQRCFRALQQALQKGCDRFGVRLIHFSIQGNHLHFIVESPDQIELGRAIKGLLVRMARALNGVMERKGQVFAHRYHAHLLRSPREAAQAVRYVLENWRVHVQRDGRPLPGGVDPYCSTAWAGCEPSLVAEPRWWMLRVGVERFRERARAA
jgi:REP element-mobilizing transposase RayT